MEGIGSDNLVIIELPDKVVGVNSELDTLPMLTLGGRVGVSLPRGWFFLFQLTEHLPRFFQFFCSARVGYPINATIAVKYLGFPAKPWIDSVSCRSNSTWLHSNRFKLPARTHPWWGATSITLMVAESPWILC